MEQSPVLPGTLYVVATPIGNRRDISQRAIDVLCSVDLIAAEDTRRSRHLLSELGVTTRLVSYHDFSDRARLRVLLDRLGEQQSVALVSDAGTPGISDPGYELVRQARLNGISVVPIPGPSAVIAALSVSGLPSDRFVFEGFLPARSQARLTHLKSLQNEPRTMIFYESPHRIMDCLKDMCDIMGAGRELFIARELTKKFETSLRGGIAECLHRLEQDPVQRKGEFVLVLAGESREARKEAQLSEGLRVLQLLVADLPLKRAARLAAEISGASKNALYQAALKNEPH